jgi:hypothetical protein
MPPQAAAATPSPFRHSMTPHLHIDNETCPFCERDIPPELLEEISGKIAAREREQAQAITTKLEQQFAADKAQADARAKADLELERRQSAIRETAVREEARLAAEAVANQKLAALEQSRQEMQTALQKQVTDAEAARLAAETAAASLQVQFQRLRQDSERALAEAKADAKSRETEIHAEAQQAAQAAVAQKLVAIESARIESEAALQAQITLADAAKLAAEQKGAALQAELEQLAKAKDAEVVQIKADAAAEALRIRQEASIAAEILVRDKMVATEQAAAEAIAKAASAEGRLATLAEQHAAVMAENLNAQREIMEKAKEDAVNVEKAKSFEENLKLSNKVAELQRALEKKNNEELGEGAEIDLFEALKAAFPDDRITRIAKGAPGADVRHVVVLHGKECGSILYDSKNHKQFRNEHVAKLKADQIADKADHAILSTHKFPQGSRELHTQDGVVLASPARVVAVVSMIRKQLIVIHSLRLSGLERESKTAALYAFITSERYSQLLASIDARAAELLKEQTKEIKWHENCWKKQGEAYRSIQKTNADLDNEISCIIGTAADDELALQDSEL